MLLLFLGARVATTAATTPAASGAELARQQHLQRIRDDEDALLLILTAL